MGIKKKRMHFIALCGLMFALLFVFACEPDDNDIPDDPWDNDCPYNAICRDEEPPGYNDGKGPYQTSSYSMPGAYVTIPSTATVYYPTNAQPPFSGLVFCPPFMGVQANFAA